MSYEKIILVTRKTRLVELVNRFNSRAQAKFVIEHAGGDFTDYEREDAAYRRALDQLRDDLGPLSRVQLVDRSFLSTFLFAKTDLVVTLGQDGLVANTAKYVGAQPIVAVNPDPERFDGILLPFDIAHAGAVVQKTLSGTQKWRQVTLALARVNDGQKLLAFNDFYVGSRTHVSSRYSIRLRKQSERHSSSGVIISTGAGSTGWLSSCFNMAAGILHAPRPEMRLDWAADQLVFVVREPFLSRTSQVELVTGAVQGGETLELESLMPTGGCIFSDGMEEDYIAFNSGTTVRIGVASQKAVLVIK